MEHKSAIVKQIAIGFVLIIVLGFVLWFIVPAPETPDRVKYVLSWATLFSLPLIVGIHTTLFQRFSSEELIKGYVSVSQPEFCKAYLSNTVEQTVLNVLTSLTLGMVAPLEYIKLVPIQAIIFVVGRLLFFFTYKINPMQRFVGFVVGYYIAIVALIASIYWAL